MACHAYMCALSWLTHSLSDYLSRDEADFVLKGGRSFRWDFC